MPRPDSPARDSRHPDLDRDAIIAGLQDQIDDLTATLEAHQRVMADLQRRLDQLETGRNGG